MTTMTYAPIATIRAILSDLPADPVADVLASQARESATMHRKFGWPGDGEGYSCAVYYGDREAVEEQLGRKMTGEEVEAFDECVRAHLDASA